MPQEPKSDDSYSQGWDGPLGLKKGEVRAP